MIIVKTPGVNGFGKTAGTRNAGREILKRVNREYRQEEIHVDNYNLEEQEFLIRKNAMKLFKEEDRVVFLGGDHSISYPLVDSFRKVFDREKKRLVIFDAHADCMQPMKEPTHEEWLKAVMDRGFEGEDILIIGLNKVEDEERKYLEERGVKMTEDVDKIKEFVKKEKLYVSFDIDVFEEVKATGYSEGKMKEDEVMKLLDVVLENGDLRGCDIVEVHLDKEGLDKTLEFARRVLGKFITSNFSS